MTHETNELTAGPRGLLGKKLAKVTPQQQWLMSRKP